MFGCLLLCEMGGSEGKMAGSDRRPPGGRPPGQAPWALCARATPAASWGTQLCLLPGLARGVYSTPPPPDPESGHTPRPLQATARGSCSDSNRRPPVLDSNGSASKGDGPGSPTRLSSHPQTPARYTLNMRRASKT